MKTLSQAFEHTLRDIYWAETALTKALPKMARAVGASDLKEAIEAHLEETRGHVTTLESVFKSLGKKASGEKCDAMAGLIKEAEGLMEEDEGEGRDAALIGAAQAVEHYEIARYGTLREWARVLGHDEAHQHLSDILDQEKAANAKLTALAVKSLNDQAIAA